MQQTSYFFSKLGKYESSLLALRMVWNAKHKYPDNRYYSDVLEDVMNDVFVKNKMKYQDFSDYPMGTNPDSIVVEERFVILGISKKTNLLTVCHCYRENEEVIRIINARKATTKEKKLVVFYYYQRIV